MTRTRTSDVQPDDLAFMGAIDLARMIAARSIGCVELLDHFIERLDRFDGLVNAVVVRDLDRARAAAMAADAAVAAGKPLPPLHGVPMTVKESFSVAGLPTTFGLPAFRNNVATCDAVAVRRLREAGAIVFGKTNVPPWLADSQSGNPVYGVTRNPWGLDRSPGGSSGGAAAALAAGLTGLELGSDIAGSIRNPAHYCGVFGHKPTFGLCPPGGHGLGDQGGETDIAAIGPLARGADDLELALRVIAGPDGDAARAFALRLPPPRTDGIAGLRVAVVADHPLAETDAAVSSVIADLARFLEKEGAVVDRDGRPPFDPGELDRLYMSMVRAATSRRLSDEAFAEASRQAARTDPHATDIGARFLRGNTMSHRDWLACDEKRHAIRQAWNGFFDEFDVLLCPIAVSAAFPLTEIPVQERTLTVNGREVSYADQFFWAGYGGLAYLPATVAPAGRTAGGLPVGVQIIGAQYDDLTCIAVARMIERNYFAFVPPDAFR